MVKGVKSLRYVHIEIGDIRFLSVSYVFRSVSSDTAF